MRWKLRTPQIVSSEIMPGFLTRCVSPRVHRCACQPAASKTFSPLTALFTGHTAPELLYLETRWASLVSFGLTVLKDVLPVDARINAATIRNHLHKVALRQEAE